jgi:hypothetical protein
MIPLILSTLVWLTGRDCCRKYMLFDEGPSRQLVPKACRANKQQQHGDTTRQEEILYSITLGYLEQMRSFSEIGKLSKTSPITAELPMIRIDIEVSGSLIQSDASRKG